MKRTTELLLLTGLIILLVSCSSAPPPVVLQPVVEGSPVSAGEASRQGADTEIIARMKEYLANGKNKLDQGAISEGITQLVSILAEGNRMPAPPAEARDLMFAAETELAKIGAGLSLEGGTEWLDANKNQITASSIDVGTPQALNPSIILTLNLGTGKALVSGAPIFFEFTRGSGLLTPFVNTADYGQANCVIARLENPNEENIVRAALVYRVGGFTYRFKGLEREFAYAPPVRKATILALEKAGDRTNEDPVVLDAIFNCLKDVAFDFSHYDGALLGERFMRVFGGDAEAIRGLGLEKGVSYLVVVLSDGYYVNQIELNGVKYNIFKSQTTTTTRIIRVSDGKILYSGTMQAVAGQGGTEEKAVLDGFRAAAEAMAGKLKADLDIIIEAMAGGNG